MAQDLIYGFNKITKKRFTIGEIQTDFNMSFVIDGTKDSCQVIVKSFNSQELEPYTIIYHQKTNSWWVVSHDKVERYTSENGFVYFHNIELLGAIELLNARDLIDCGFNQNTYTIEQFTKRLFGLSNFEFTLNINFGEIEKDILVDYVKTFENYTLLSALREFYNGYNSSLTLSFTTTGVDNTISFANLIIIPKTGNTELNVLSIDYFDDAKETKTVDKDSFGATVISNAENVISTVDKTFPSQGSIKLSSSQFKMTPANAILRLPSKVFKGNWIKMYYRVAASVKIAYGNYEWSSRLWYFPKNPTSIDKIINDAYQTLADYNNQWEYFAAQFRTYAFAHKAELQKNLDEVGTITLYDGNNVDPTYNNGAGKIKKGKNVPYLVDLDTGSGDKQMVFCDKESKDSLPDKHEGIAWERGSNIISGFEFLSEWGSVHVDLENTDYLIDDPTMIQWNNSNDPDDVKISITVNSTQNVKATSGIPSKYLSFAVNYIPMSDLKIKVDNSTDKIDSQLYNQTGKLTDTSALSKLLNSYSKEISSDTITKYKTFYNFSDVPKVGRLVNNNGIIYVINNVSLDFYENESTNANNFGYYINGEFTMSKKVAVKSLMVNPNTNIRDYGIPQNFNVKRKQLYRDYYELTYEIMSDANQNDPYLDISNLLNFGVEKKDFNLMAVIKLDYDQTVSGETSWYYQLETVNYYLDKMVYIVLDFNDNNIIGYGSQNAYGGFDLSRIFSSSGWLDNINTPISYVDADGKVLNIDLLFLDNVQITSVYDYYILQHGYSGEDDALNVYNYSVFIPGELYDDCIQYSLWKMRITENDYKKDALEVPVFEYACQIDDSLDVIIGDNILLQPKDRQYIYTFIIGNNLTKNNVLDAQSMETHTGPVRAIFDNGALVEYDDTNNIKKILLSIYEDVTYYTSSKTYSFGEQIAFQEGKDIAVFRHSCAKFTARDKINEVDLLFIVKNVKLSNVSDGKLTLYFNHYKLN